MAPDIRECYCGVVDGTAVTKMPYIMDSCHFPHGRTLWADICSKQGFKNYLTICRNEYKDEGVLWISK